jgi:hypothetical protein
MKGRAGVDGREGEREKKKKKKEKKKRTGIHLAFVSGRAQRARVKNGETPPSRFPERGRPHVPAERRGKGQQE